MYTQGVLVSNRSRCAAIDAEVDVDVDVDVGAETDRTELAVASEGAALVVVRVSETVVAWMFGSLARAPLNDAPNTAMVTTNAVAHEPQNAYAFRRTLDTIDEMSADQNHH